MSLEIRVESIEGIPVVAAAGDVDMLTSNRLREAVLDVINAGNNRLVIDLREVGFLDSSGLMVLIQALKRTRQAGGGVALADRTQPLRPVIRVTGLNKTFGIFPDPRDAAVSLMETAQSTRGG